MTLTLKCDLLRNIPHSSTQMNANEQNTEFKYDKRFTNFHTINIPQLIIQNPIKHPLEPH